MSKKFCIVKTHEGFTLPELIIVVSLVLILFSIGSVNLITFQQKEELQTSTLNVITDIRSQQIKAMTGDTEGRSESDSYGIRLETDKYILFHGNTYSSSDQSNFVINLPQNLEFSNILVPNSQIVFVRPSGEVNGYLSNQDSFSILDTTNNSQKNIRVNRYGVLSDVN